MALPYVSRQIDRGGRVHFYFKRAGFPRVRLPKPENAEEFDRIYRRALACASLDDFLALRQVMGMPPCKPRPPDPAADAIMAWAEHRPLSEEQRAILRRRLGLTDAEIDERFSRSNGRRLNSGSA
jgi:hypothetical protein